MQVRIVTNLGSLEFPGSLFGREESPVDGETLDVNDQLAAKLVRRGLAEEVPQKPAKAKAEAVVESAPEPATTERTKTSKK